jgi:hypothetical protein
VLPGRAEIVSRIFQEYLAGIGPHLIAERLNRDGIGPFGRGRYWHRSYVVKLLDSPAVIGTYIPHEVEYIEGRRKRMAREAVEGYYPRIIDLETFASVREMRSGRRSPHSKMGTTPSGVSHLLAGLARCPKCGGAMVRVNKGAGSKGGYPYLICARAKAGAGCIYHGVRVEAVELAVSNAAEPLAASMPAGSPLLLDTEARYAEDLRAAQREVDTWLTAIADGARGSGVNEKLRQAEDKRDRSEAGLNEVRARLRGFDALSRRARLGDLAAALSGERTAEANALLRLLFKQVVVDWEPSRLVFAWQQGGISSIAYGESASQVNPVAA